MRLDRRPHHRRGGLRRRALSVVILAVIGCGLAGIDLSAAPGAAASAYGPGYFTPGSEISLSSSVVHAGESVQVTSVVPCRGPVPAGFKRLAAQVYLSATARRGGQRLFPRKRIFGSKDTGAWTTRVTVARNARPGIYELKAACTALTGGVTRDAGVVDESQLTTFEFLYVEGPAMTASLPSGTSLRPGSSSVLHVRNVFDCDVLQAVIDRDDRTHQLGLASRSAAQAARTTADVPITVPSAISPGSHVVSVYCEFPLQINVAAAAASLPVTITSRSGDTTAVSASLPTPHQVARDHLGRTLAIGLLLAVLATLLVGFPAELFNKTVEENRAEIRDWFPDWLSRRPRLPGRLDLVIFLIIGGVLLTSVDRRVEAGGPGLVRAATYTFVAAVVAIVVTTVLYQAPAEGILRRASRTRARLGTVPFAVAAAIILGLLSYAGHFVPGYIYGLFITYLASKDRDVDTQSAGAAVVTGTAGLLGVSILLWPLESLHPDAGTLPQAVLAWIVIMGIQTSVFLLLPLRFLDGYKLFRWRRSLWAALFLVACFFFFVLMVLQSHDPYLESHRRDAIVTSMTLFAAFGLGSFAFWAYFRFRPEPSEDAKNGADRRSGGVIAASAVPPAVEQPAGTPVSGRGRQPELAQFPYKETHAHATAPDRENGDPRYSQPGRASDARVPGRGRHAARPRRRGQAPGRRFRI